MNTTITLNKNPVSERSNTSLPPENVLKRTYSILKSLSDYYAIKSQNDFNYQKDRGLLVFLAHEDNINYNSIRKLSPTYLEKFSKEHTNVFSDKIFDFFEDFRKHDGGIVINHTGDVYLAKICVTDLYSTGNNIKETGTRHLALLNFTKNIKNSIGMVLSDETLKVRVSKDGEHLKHLDYSPIRNF